MSAKKVPALLEDTPMNIQSAASPLIVYSSLTQYQFGNVMLLNCEMLLAVCSRMMIAFMLATTSGYCDARLLPPVRSRFDKRLQYIFAVNCKSSKNH